MQNMLRKLLMIVFGISLVLAAGSCNIYPLYINEIMEKFGFSLKEINLFGSFINSGLWIAFTMGLFYDKYGPKLSCILGAIFLSGSYAALHLIMNSTLKSISIFPLLLIGLVMGQGSALCFTAAISSNLKNFYSNNSAIVGLLVSNMAISPSIFTTYRQALSHVRIANYFLMISVFLAIVILTCGWVFTNLKQLYSDHDKLKDYERYKEKRIIRLLVITNVLILVIYTFGVVFNNVFSDEDRFPNAIVYPCLQMLNFLFIVLEMCGYWEKVYFPEFIEKEVKLKLKLEESKEKNNRNFNKNLLYMNSKKKNQEALEQQSKEDIKSKENKSENKLDNLHNSPVKIEKSNFKRRNSMEIKNSKFINLEINNKEEHLNNTVSDNIFFQKNADLFYRENNIIPSNMKQQANSNLSQEENNNPKITDILDEDLFDKDKNLHVQQNAEETVNELKLFWLIIMKKEVLILFLMLLLGIGSVISNLNNIQFIISSIYPSPLNKEIFNYALLYFVFNSFCRIFSGVIIDNLIENKKAFLFLIFISIMGMISQLLGIFMDKDMLFFSMAMAGATHGGYMTFTPIYSKKFGVKNMGKVLGLLTTGCAFGSIIVADLIFLHSYEQNQIDGKCIGKKCFSTSYIITTCFFIVNIILSVILTRQSKE